jgi:hypothetical protein
MTTLGRQTVSFRGFSLYGFSKPHAGATAVLVDEFDAGTLQRGLNFCSGAAPATHRTIIRFKPFDCRERDAGGFCQIFLRPGQQRARSLNLSY